MPDSNLTVTTGRRYWRQPQKVHEGESDFGRSERRPLVLTQTTIRIRGYLRHRVGRGGSENEKRDKIEDKIQS